MALGAIARLSLKAVWDGDARAALLAVASRMPVALLRRRPVPAAVEAAIRRMAEDRP